ncbi:MAG: thioredoxin family protein [Butyricicoccus sp.]
MGLFGFGKKKEEKQAPACGSGAGSSISGIKVLGAGCKSCHEQYENAKAAVKALGLSAEVEYITDMEKIMAYGAMSMPAIVVNEKVVSMGRVLKAAEVEKLLHKLEF